MGDSMGDSETHAHDTDSTARIAELEQRIHAALERMSQALDQVGSAGPAGAQDAAAQDQQLAELTSALELEKNTNAQLEERLQTLRAREQGAMAELEERVKGFGQRSAEQERELARMREINAGLRENNAALRTANAAGLADARLVNAGLQAEVDALQEDRLTDRNEIDAILTELRPVVAAAATTEVSGQEQEPG